LVIVKHGNYKVGRRKQTSTTERQKERAMTSEAGPTGANTTVVRESVEAFNTGDVAKLLAVAAPDIVIHYAEMPEPLRGRETWQQGYELVKRAFPDLKIHVDDLVAAGDKVALRLTLSGTHQGEFQGIPATGRTISYVSHEFYRLADGVVAEEWICSDMASLFSQLS
jgi:steroid delta-isomerase-like uncharacterized protein